MQLLPVIGAGVALPRRQYAPDAVRRVTSRLGEMLSTCNGLGYSSKVGRVGEAAELFLHGLRED